MKVILAANNIEKQFKNEKVLKGISLSVFENTFTTILGPSGSGKSTLLSILSGQLRPTSGNVQYLDEIISSFSEIQMAEWKRSEIGYVFQNYLLLNNLTAEENIKIGINPKKTPISFDRLIATLEIDDILDKFPAQLSGGQQQRVSIARAVIKCPSLLFCDEATGSLDEANSKKVIGLLHEMKDTYGLTILFTTHNKEIAETANRVLTIRDGLLSNDVVNKNPILSSDMVWR
ncbi:MAG: ABC transporter ATP-binding protein [Velocimicrobium sp.]